MDIKTKNYTTPSMRIFSLKMEEGIAAGSDGTTTPGTTPVIIDYEDGEGGSEWIVDGF